MPKISREKTKDLEADALTVLATKSLPKNYKTNLIILDFLYDIAVLEKRFTNAEGYLNQIAEMKKELCGEKLCRVSSCKTFNSKLLHRLYQQKLKKPERSMTKVISRS